MHLLRGEGFLTRGKLYVQMQRWDKAVQDFYRAASLDHESGEAFLGLADAFRGLGEYSNAIQAYSKAAEHHSTMLPALMRAVDFIWTWGSISRP